MEHVRGVRMSAFSSGVSFTGAFGKWFWGQGPVLGPTAQEEQAESTRILLRGWRPYVGLGMGVASAKVNRPDEIVTTVEDSGVYFSSKLGAELLYAPGRAGRVELGIFSASGSVLSKGSVSGLHLMFSILFL